MHRTTRSDVDGHGDHGSRRRTETGAAAARARGSGGDTSGRHGNILAVVGDFAPR